MLMKKHIWLSILSFLLGSTVTLFFVTIDKSETLNASSVFRFGHSVNYQNISNNYFLLILIITNPENVAKRNAIRETWLQFAGDDKSVKHLFALGTKNLAHHVQREITDEFVKNGDIIPLSDIEDSYKTLSRKVLSSFVSVVQEYNFKFLLKCDDDSFARVSEIVKELKTTFHSTQLLYWGFFDGRAHVKRSGKWIENNWFLCDRYLPYALGGGYVLSQSLVKYISKNANLLSLYKSEDVSLGVWLSPLNISRVHEPKFDTEYISRGCSNKFLITHKQTESSMRHLYSELVTHGRMCSQEIEYKQSYIYNWDVSPSKCCVRNYSIVY